MYQHAFNYLDGYDVFNIPIYPSDANKLEDNFKRMQIMRIITSLKSIAIDDIAISLGLFEQFYSDHYHCRQTINQGNTSNLETCGKLLKLVTHTANTFLVSVDKYLKIIKTLKRYEELKEAIDELIAELDYQIPNISHIRNSALHVEQRLYQEAREKPIDYKNENYEGFLIGVLQGITLIYTSEKGVNVGIEVSINTLKIIKQNYEKLKVILKEKYQLANY